MAKFEKIFNAAPEARKKESLPRRETKWIHYSKLKDNENQYCNEKDKAEIVALAGIIEADGMVLQNLLVRKTDADEYEIIGGHKRRRACRYLVEEEGKKQYEFLPCMIENISDVCAEFQLYSSNIHHQKDDYEIMHELERMKYLLENYPEEFPHLQTGRMVERLAKQMNMKRTTVGEYLTISKNLGEKAMEAFREGEMNKSAALEMSSLPEEEQDTLVEQGVTAQKDIQAYKGSKEPSEDVIRLFYKEYAKEYDTDRSQLKEKLKEWFGKSHCGMSDGELNVTCTPRGIRLNGCDEITWARLIQLINIYIPKQNGISQMEKEDVPESGTQEPEENVPESGTQELEDEITDVDPEYYEQEDVQRLLEEYTEDLKAYREAELPGRIRKEQKIIADALTFYLQEIKRQEKAVEASEMR